MISNTISSPYLRTTFAQNLLVVRLALDWTQQRLAISASLSRATIAQLEAGTGDPKLSTIEQLAKALGVSPVLLLLGERELDALHAHSHREWPQKIIQHPFIQIMKQLLATGFMRSRLEVSTMGVRLAQQAGMGEDHGGRMGAAVGSFHRPGPGTLAAASWSQMFVQDPAGVENSSHASPDSRQPTRKDA